MPEISKILVANRGEIAIRVMRSAKEMGIKTVAVYSDADRFAEHVRYADEAIHIGPTPSAESYLRIDKLIAAAKNTGAEAIHPGYGFLSERAEFAQAVKEAGLIFIGPSAESIEVMGSKLGAKAAVSKFNIPMVPGSPGAISDPNEARKLAEAIGYPILIKASAGGGGKGMRVVTNSEELEDQMKRAISEATAAFGDGSVFIEKYILNPKHIEVQIIGDQHGNVRYLFERECSVQRRHQKLVEEAPSALMSPEKRKEIGEAAVRVAQACGYYSTGTVEFVSDQEFNYYFLEMNTRLQVEHPVTELITSLDLVKEQIKVAMGQPLSFSQDQVKLNGHAIEVRVCAEDPFENFMPDAGILKTYERPSGAGIRVDDGVKQGSEITVFYDPMFAKLIAYGHNRTEAIQRLKRAISEYKITGLKTTLPFFIFVLDHPDFIDGSYDTGFISKHFKPEDLNQALTEDEQNIAAIVAGMVLSSSEAKPQTVQSNSTNGSAWLAKRGQLS